MEVGLHNIASRLIKLGHRPIVIAPYSHVQQLKEQEFDLPYEVIAFPPKLLSFLEKFPSSGFFAFDCFFSWTQWRYHFDVWHITMGYPLGVAMVHYGKQCSTINYLTRCAGDDIQVSQDIGYGMRLNPVIDRLVREYLPQSQMLIAISDSVKSEYLELGTSEKVIRSVPNGVALERFKIEIDTDKVRRIFGLEPQSFVFLSVGRNHPKKNYSTLIKAAGLLQSMTDQVFELVIVGRGVEALEQNIAECGNPPVHLINEIGDSQNSAKVPNIPGQNLIELYRTADVFVFPSLMETFGIAIVEAMAAGLPVIVGDSAGCRDIVRHGQDGLMVPPDDAMRCAEAMCQLMADSSMKNEYAKRSEKRAKDFSWDVVVDDYCNLYHELIGY